MISVQLMTGDMVMSADGTVTYVDGHKIYAFGHRFLAAGSTELPFSRADVLTDSAQLERVLQNLRGKAVGRQHDQRPQHRRGRRDWPVGASGAAFH